MQAGNVSPETVDQQTEWYHCMTIDGVRTPGEFELDDVSATVPWPDLTGRRCLDVATFDGFWAFEMERRGASEVAALDIPDFSHVDYLPRRRAAATAGPTGAGFRYARARKGSEVTRLEGSVYDLSPEDVGTFDVCFMGALLLHLRDPMAALDAIRSVCRGVFVSVDQVDGRTTVLHRRQPLMAVRGEMDWVWTVPNAAGHRRMVEVAGFDVEDTALALAPYGPAVDEATLRRANSPRRLLGQRLLGLPAVPGLVLSIVVGRAVDLPPRDRARLPAREAEPH